MTIGVIATLTVADGKNAEFEAVFAELAKAVNSDEPGNIHYALFQTSNDPQQYKVLESYTDQAALEAHRDTPHYVNAGPNLVDLLAGAPDIEILKGV